MYTQALAFKVRRLHPCLLSDVRFDVDLPDDDDDKELYGEWGTGCCVPAS